MAEDSLLLTVEGDGFKVSLQGSGDPEAAKAAVSAAFGGAEVSVIVVEPVDMSGH